MDEKGDGKGAQPKSVRIQPSGEMTKRVNQDGSVSLSSKQPVSLHIETIKSIGIENLIDVEVHAINTLFNSVSHYIKFFGGGEIRFSYNSEGKLMEFSATNVTAEIANGERLILKRTPDAPNAGE